MIILDKNHKNIIKVDNHYELLEFPSLEKDYEIRLDKVLHILAPISKSSININIFDINNIINMCTSYTYLILQIYTVVNI